MTITRKARGTEIPHRAQRVFFCCDPQNTGKRDDLIADLLSMDAGMDCVVSYLEPQEDIDTETLRNELREHQAVALWVTAQLLKKNDQGEDNYVMTTEYPFAREEKKPVLPVEALPTDSGRFVEFFSGAGYAVSIDDHAALKAVLREKLGESACLGQIDGERAYLLGNAYLKGFGLERDFNRGIRLLEHASESSGSSALSATEQLAEIHKEGIGTVVDYAKALQWRKRAVVISEQLYGAEHPITASAYNDMASVYNIQGDYPRALEWYNKALAVYEPLAIADPGKYGKDAEATREALEKLKGVN
jgi:tetratricopeptide (TPR) repeat protein